MFGSMSSLTGGGGMSGGAGGAATGGNQTTTNRSGFDSSGWTVATGSGKASGALNPWMIAGGFALAALWILKKK